MDGSRLSDFSIERILSPQLGHSRAEPQPLHGRVGADTGALRAPPPPPLQYCGMSYEEPCFQYFHHPDFSFYSTSGVHLHPSSQQEAPGQWTGSYWDNLWVTGNQAQPSGSLLVHLQTGGNVNSRTCFTRRILCFNIYRRQLL